MTGIYALPVELLDELLILEPQLAYTCRYLYNLNLKNKYVRLKGPGCFSPPFVFYRYTLEENTVQRIISFNRRLKRIAAHPLGSYVRKVYVNMHNSRSGKMEAHMSTLAHNLRQLTKVHQLTINLSTLYHILYFKDVVNENIKTLVLECRAASLEENEASEVLNVLLSTFPSIEKILIYAGTNINDSVASLLEKISESSERFDRLKYFAVAYRKWSGHLISSTLLYLDEYASSDDGSFTHNLTVLAPISDYDNRLRDSATMTRVLDSMGVSKHETLLHRVTNGYE